MNKTYGLFRLRWLPILLAVVFLSGCASFKNACYRMAINHECAKADLEKKIIDVNGMTIALLENESRRSTPDIVLLHGFGASKEDWIPFAAYLTGTYHVVAIDLPGHGESVKDFNLHYGIMDQVRYLHEILDHLKISKCSLAGNSMGGEIAAMYAATYPNQVTTLLLIDPGGIYDYPSEFTQLYQKGENPLIVKNKKDFYHLMDFALEKKPFIPWPITSVIAEKAVSDRAINEKIFADIKAPHSYVFKDAIKKIQAPTLIMWGKDDRIINYENASVFEKLIPDSQKIVLDGIGHAAMLETPEKSAEIYKAFLSSHIHMQIANP